MPRGIICAIFLFSLSAHAELDLLDSLYDPGASPDTNTASIDTGSDGGLEILDFDLDDPFGNGSSDPINDPFGEIFETGATDGSGTLEGDLGGYTPPTDPFQLRLLANTLANYLVCTQVNSCAGFLDTGNACNQACIVQAKDETVAMEQARQVNEFFAAKAAFDQQNQSSSGGIDPMMLMMLGGDGGGSNDLLPLLLSGGLGGGGSSSGGGLGNNALLPMLLGGGGGF